MNSENALDYDSLIEGLAEFTPSCSGLVADEQAHPDVPDAVSAQGLGWAGVVYYYNDRAIRAELDGAPVYQLQDGRYAIIKDGELLEVALDFTVTARLLQ